MRYSANMNIPSALRKHLSAIGKRGGKARWKGKSAAKKSAHARAMLAARYGKKNGA